MENVFVFFLLIVLIVALFAYIGFLYYSNCKKLAEQKQKFNNLRQVTDALDLQVDGFKLLFQKYHAQLPENILAEIEEECQKLQQKADRATTKQELFDAKLLEERWRSVQKCVLQSLKNKGHF